MNPRKRGSMYTGSGCVWVASLVLLLPLHAQEAVDPTEQLISVQRLCVEPFVGLNPAAAQAREMAIVQLFKGKRFRVTEKCEKADGILKGSITTRSNQRARSEGEETNFGVLAGGANRTAAAVGAIAGGSSETLASIETISQASITLRIVNVDGETVWAHTEEAKEGKVKGPVAFAMERAVRKLLRDIDKARAPDRKE